MNDEESSALPEQLPQHDEKQLRARLATILADGLIRLFERSMPENDDGHTLRNDEEKYSENRVDEGGRSSHVSRARTSTKEQR